MLSEDYNPNLRKFYLWLRLASNFSDQSEKRLRTSTLLPSATSNSNSSTSSAIAFQGGAAKPDQWESMVILGALLAGSLLLFVNGLSLA